ncbi:ubiquitin carboxyl-terminal hydrolase 37 isoform X1 [Paramuricea clavata]|uniref:Ubiquitin carboxyl-terminal hydrolase 37 isoform X1 n=1 Tax=Paramuricea clavata TaxID=317549 RepID=A0A7D9DVY2_PARCT|nr:ubiquitin carboxyl-terminal hydrolase 37 isoform X1 [Paramuricea clavata]
MYNLFRWKNDDGSSTRKKNALKRLKNSLNGSEMTKRFSGYLQNDAHEFMNICLDQMKEEVQEALGEKSEDIAAKVCPVVRNFEGSLRKYIKCKGCKDVVTKDELFNHLSLNIPHNQSRSPTKVQLTRLLGRFFQAEELERSCEKCKCATAVQYLKIRTLPRVIILHLLRSEFDQYRGTQEKNSHRIQVDRFLEIGSFCSSDISGPPPFVPKKTSHV